MKYEYDDKTGEWVNPNKPRGESHDHNPKNGCGSVVVIAIIVLYFIASIIMYLFG